MREHGRTSSYAHGCRCPDCRAARMDYQRRQRGTITPMPHDDVMDTILEVLSA